jgi:hypothetical protein
VAVTAVPDAGFSFTGWSGDLSGATNPETLLVDGNKTVSASFAQSFTVSVTPTSGGSVTLNPPGGTYAAGTSVTLTAVPDAGFSFTGWSGDLSGATNPETLLVDGDKTVGASFDPLYDLTVRTSGNGTVSLNPPGGTYPAGTLVTVTAVPGGNFVFDRWSDDLSGSQNPETVTMDSDTSIRAVFRKQKN